MGQKPLGVPGTPASTPAFPEGKQVTVLCAQCHINNDPLKRPFIISPFSHKECFLYKNQKLLMNLYMCMYVHYDYDMIILYI